MQAVSLSFFRFDGFWNRLWVIGQMGAARWPLRSRPEIGFFKLFGSGTGEGFTPIPNFGVWAILATWPDCETAKRVIGEAPVYRRWRKHATEHATVYLSAFASRGAWDGAPPFRTDGGPPAGEPIAVLTRATIRKRHVLRFWSQQPDVSKLVREQRQLRFKIGLGEVPWFQQVTFSIWDDAEAMKAFAYQSASHGGAVKAVRQNHWFKEELYARFRVLDAEGRWQGVDISGTLRTSSALDAPVLDALAFAAE
jgi:spheroidene monooxygenase